MTYKRIINLPIAFLLSFFLNNNAFMAQSAESAYHYILGDVNGDCIIDARDASNVLTYYAALSSGSDYINENFFTECADYNKDGVIDGRDASEILVNYVKTSVAAEVLSPPMNLPNGQLVRILDYIPNAVIDLRYATENNFTGKIIYNSQEAYLCFGTVKKLINVQKQLKERGYRILIWDAYRPREAQWALWNVCPDPNFVANPNNGITSHERGNTVDISLVHDKDGSPVVMPSGFDEFNSFADRNYNDVSAEAASNSKLLEEIMYNNGFTGYKGEWWDYSDTEKYEIIP